MTLLRSGDNLLISHRRLYLEDVARHYVGSVDECEGSIVQLTGVTFVRESRTGSYVRKPGVRTKILSLASGSLIVYRLPNEIHIETLDIENRGELGLFMVDGQGFELNLTERAV